MNQLEYIDSNNSLKIFCQKFSTTQIALDTEFKRENTYSPQLALIQICAADGLAVIDPLSITQFLPLCDLLQNANIEKIIHSPRQDIETLHHTLGAIPLPIFDTQLAAAFLGFDMQISYQNLVEKKINVKLSKTEVRSNWLQRPLSKEQIQYAINDVLYLDNLQALLTEELKQHKKYSWFIEETQQRARQPLPISYWEKIKDGVLCKNIQEYTHLKQLTKWRENKALQKQKPRQWIASDQCLHLLAAEDKLDKKKFMAQKNCSKIYRYADEIILLLKSTTPLDNTLLPQILILTKQQKKELKALQVLVENIAQSHSIATSLLATKKQLIAIVKDKLRTATLSAWRRNLLEEDFKKILLTV